jgi:hypothetical protein
MAAQRRSAASAVRPPPASFAADAEAPPATRPDTFIIRKLHMSSEPYLSHCKISAAHVRINCISCCIENGVCYRIFAGAQQGAGAELGCAGGSAARPRRPQPQSISSGRKSEADMPDPFPRVPSDLAAAATEYAALQSQPSRSAVRLPYLPDGVHGSRAQPDGDAA